MAILDCDSLDTALSSLADLLQMDTTDLAARLNGFNYDDLPGEERETYPCEDLLPRHALGLNPNQLPIPTETSWYHATRVRPGTTFSEGILPLSAMLELIWADLAALASDWSSPAQWSRFRENMGGQGAEQYSGKLAFQSHGGPFAFLVRPIIFQPRAVGNHDYLGVPEIVEDICLSYEETVGHDLQRRFVDATRPCIVKFKTTRRPEDNAVRAALMFVQRSLVGDELSLWCNTCYSGNGSPVPPSGHRPN